MYQIKQPIDVGAYLLSLWYASCAVLLLVAYGIYDPTYNCCVYMVSAGDGALYVGLSYFIHSGIALLWYCFGSAGVCWVGIFSWLSYNAMIKPFRIFDVPRCIAWGVLLVCWSTITAWYNVDMLYACVPGGLCGEGMCYVLRKLPDPIIGMVGMLVILWGALLVLLGNGGLCF